MTVTRRDSAACRCFCRPRARSSVGAVGADRLSIGRPDLDQQASDEAACRTYAQQQSGVYPNQAPPGYYGNPNEGAPVARGAARGAAVGAVGGAIAGDAGEGAAVGAGVGATAGLMRRNQQRRQQAQANDQAMAHYQADMGRYNQAFAACMQGRGYSVR